jgi:hypothetical protein
MKGQSLIHRARGHGINLEHVSDRLKSSQERDENDQIPIKFKAE